MDQWCISIHYYSFLLLFQSLLQPTFKPIGHLFHALQWYLGLMISKCETHDEESCCIPIVVETRKLIGPFLDQTLARNFAVQLHFSEQLLAQNVLKYSTLLDTSTQTFRGQMKLVVHFRFIWKFHLKAVVFALLLASTQHDFRAASCLKHETDQRETPFKPHS